MANKNDVDPTTPGGRADAIRAQHVIYRKDVIPLLQTAADALGADVNWTPTRLSNVFNNGKGITPDEIACFLVLDEEGRDFSWFWYGGDHIAAARRGLFATHEPATTPAAKRERASSDLVEHHVDVLKRARSKVRKKKLQKPRKRSG